MNRGRLIIVLLLAIIVAGGYSVLRNARNDNNNFYNSDTMSDNTNTQDDVAASGDVAGAQTTNPSSKADKYDKAPAVLVEADRTNKQATIKTGKGDIVIKLFGDEAPMAVSNFIFLTKEGFYDGVIFHRREEGFVIQGGDPLGKGYGGPGYQFEDEPVTKEYTRGIVAMANAGPDTNGSQFFVMLGDVPLPPSYTIFGEVTSGMEVVDKIVIGDVMEAVTITDL